MKTCRAFVLLASLIGSLATAVAQPAATPDAAPPVKAAPVADDNSHQPLPPPPAATAAPALPAVAASQTNGEKGLRFNFRNVPLQRVLEYLSDAAGFIIILETRVEGTVDAWSNQPLTKDEAVGLLDSVLNQKGYAAIQNGRTLTIVNREEAKKRNIPVKVGSDPDAIPRDDVMVTQVIPIRYANALQMTKDLTPLLPTFANLTANESGNALVLTDTQSDVRRMTEIVKALDTSIASISTIKVYPLKYADAKDLASAVKELFTPSTGQGNNARNQVGFGRGGRGGFGGGGFGGGGFGGFGGPGGGGGGGAADPNAGTGVSEARNAASRVVAVADDRANALVVSAPDEYITSIDQLVKELDVTVADITELRVFHLINADPVELADQFASLFPDETKTGNDQNQNPFGIRFNRGGAGGFGAFGVAGRGNNSQTTGDSERAKKKGRVLAVPDQRTSSIIVTAASEMMPQIADMVAALDASPARKQRVFVYNLENADPQEALQILQSMFQRTTTSANSRNNQNQTSPLTTRSTTSSTTSGSTGMGTTGTGLGSSGGLGGTGGGRLP